MTITMPVYLIISVTILIVSMILLILSFVRKYKGMKAVRGVFIFLIVVSVWACLVYFTSLPVWTILAVPGAIVLLAIAMGLLNRTERAQRWRWRRIYQKAVQRAEYVQNYYPGRG